MQELEHFCILYQNTIQLVVAVGTMLSCIISLYLSLRKPRTIAKGNLYRGNRWRTVSNVFFEVGERNAENDDHEKYVAIVNNLSQFPIYLTNGILVLRLCGFELIKLAMSSPRALHPYTIDPGKLLKLSCGAEDFEPRLGRLKYRKFDYIKLRIMLFLGLDYFCSYRGCFYLTNEQQVKVKISPDIRDRIRILIR